MIIRALQENEQEECLDLWEAAFPDTGRDYFIRYFRGDADYQSGDTIVCEAGGKVVSAVHIVRRSIERGDLRLKMAGIANVSTLPEARGRGYSSACLQRAIDQIASDDFDFSLLGTGIHDFYARLGWVRTPLPACEATIDPAKVAPYTDVRTASLDDIPLLTDLYTKQNQGRPLTVQRSESYWRDWCGLSHPAGLDRLRVAANNRGYICFRLDDTSVILYEVAAEDSATERTLLLSVLEQRGDRTRAYIEAVVSPENKDLFTDWKYCPAPWWMSRLADPKRLFHKLAVAAGQPDAVADDILAALPTETLFGYLYGTQEPGTEPLRALFPPCPTPAWYDWDGF